MKYFYTIIICFSYTFLTGQIKNVFVENYYIADSFDATDQNGGELKEGSITRRIYVELEDSTKIRKIFGSKDHPLIFKTSDVFFNHKQEGISFAKDLNKARLELGTLPLDTWLTIGQASRNSASGTLYGTPKTQDGDGSLLGGYLNDGGSNEYIFGLLNNVDNVSQKPINKFDGFFSHPKSLNSSWRDLGILDVISKKDTTIFGAPNKRLFYNENCELSTIVDADFNKYVKSILIGQFTSNGDLEFELNFEVEITKNGITSIVRYMSRGQNLAPNEVFNPNLKFPKICGCKDSDYIEASSEFACEDNSKCLTKIKFGCMDSLACNYDSKANVNLEDLCCYIGFCQDRDIDVVCPDLPIRSDENVNIKIYPSLVEDALYFSSSYKLYENVSIKIYCANGRLIENITQNGLPDSIFLGDLVPGVYYVEIGYTSGKLVNKIVKI